MITKLLADLEFSQIIGESTAHTETGTRVLDKYKSFILNDIDKKYVKMLDAGATTFWETEEGAKSLANTGSLCHGWSAMPIYYYDLLNGEDYFNGTL